MTTDEAIAHFGSAAALGRAINVTRSAVQQWGDRPPVARQYQIQVKSGGAIKADAEPKDPESSVA